MTLSPAGLVLVGLLACLWACAWIITILVLRWRVELERRYRVEEGTA